MKNMLFDRDQVLEKLKENLEKHKKDYEEAIQGYKKECKDWWNSKFKLFKELKKKHYENGTVPNLDDLDFDIDFSEPRSHESDYETVISMLEFTTDDRIELDENSYRRYILDQWNWSEQFARATALYKSKIGF